MREHTEALAPPRALWVPFMLGRPLGAPNDPAFQKRVLHAALALLERPDGPVLEDFPEEAPSHGEEADDEAAACPVSFVAAEPYASLAEEVSAEVGALRMWHELAVRARGRTALTAPDVAVEMLAAFVGGWSEGLRPPSVYDETAPADALRRACEDLKTYYLEARGAQPGSERDAAIHRWLWQDTALARLLLRLSTVLEDDEEPAVRDFARNYLVPRAVRHRAQREGAAGS